jgi:DNA-directed RNA polymerase subunit H
MSSINPLLLPVKKDSDTIKQTVLENIVNMFNKRKWINNENVKTQITNMLDNPNDDQIYKIQLDVDLVKVDTYYPIEEDEERKFDKEFNGRYVIIKLLPQNITSIGKSPIIGEFLSTYNKFHRLIVVDDISEKVRNTLLSSKYLEIFKESFLMIDLLEHYCSPKYEVLSPKEAKEFTISYNTPRRNLQYILDTDPVSMYLYLERGQIIRAIRYSEVSGEAVAYRIVVHKKS